VLASSLFNGIEGIKAGSTKSGDIEMGGTDQNSRDN